MAKTKTVKIPQMAHHKATGQAYVRIDQKRIYLGKSLLPETQQEYRRVIAEYLANGCKLNPSPNYSATIAELCADFLVFAEGHYKSRNGKISTEVANFKTTIKIMVSLYGDILIKGFGAPELECIQQWQVREGHSRQYINKMTVRIRRIFKWGLKKKLVSQEVFWSLKAVEGLRNGYTDAPESKKIKPVSIESVEATKDYVSKPAWAMIQLQLLVWYVIFKWVVYPKAVESRRK